MPSEATLLRVVRVVYSASHETLFMENQLISLLANTTSHRYLVHKTLMTTNRSQHNTSISIFSEQAKISNGILQIVFGQV